jgi:hypothetical protein
MFDSTPVLPLFVVLVLADILLSNWMRERLRDEIDRRHTIFTWWSDRERYRKQYGIDALYLLTLVPFTLWPILIVLIFGPPMTVSR